MSSQQHDRQIRVRLSAGQYDALHREAAAEDRPLAQYVRHLLVRHVAGAGRITEVVKGA